MVGHSEKGRVSGVGSVGNMGGRAQDRNRNGLKFKDPKPIHHEPGFRRSHQAGWVYLPSSIQCLLDKFLSRVPKGQEREGSKPYSNLFLYYSRRPHTPHQTHMEQAVTYILKKRPSIVAQNFLGHEREPVLLPRDCSERLESLVQHVVN